MLHYSEHSPIQKTLVLIGLVFVGVLFSVGLSGFLLPNIYGLSMADMILSVQDASFAIPASASRLFAALQQIFTFLLPGLICYYIYRQKVFKYAYSDGLILYVIVLYLASIPLVEFAYYINQFIPNNWFVNESAFSQALIHQMVLQEGTLYKVANIFVLCVLPAVGEELVFRFTLQNKILSDTKLGNFGAIIVTSLIFSFIHFEMSGFLPRFVLSLILGLSYVYSKTLLVPITFHLMNNYLAFTQMASNSEISFFQRMFYSSSFISVLLVIISTFICFWLIRTMGKNVKLRI